MSKEYKILTEALKSIKEKIPYKPEIAITLGSGLGDFVNELKQDAVIDYKNIKHFPKTTNTNHKGKFVFAKINGVNVVVMQGRIHFYEGYTTTEAVRPTRIAKMMGAKTLIVTNAAGGINKQFKPGDIMIIKDHISFYILNPLLGENVEELGVRFPDMTNVYDQKIIKTIKDIATKNKIIVKDGVYAQLTGPTYETASEVKLLGKLGVDAVGMSTVIETIAARHAGMKIAGLSVITNLGTGLSKKTLDDEEVKKVASKVSNKMKKIILGIVGKI